MNCQVTRFVPFVLFALCVSTNVFPMLSVTQRSLVPFVMRRTNIVFKRYCSTKKPDSDITKLIAQQNEEIKLLKWNDFIGYSAAIFLMTGSFYAYHGMLRDSLSFKFRSVHRKLESIGGDVSSIKKLLREMELKEIKKQRA